MQIINKYNKAETDSWKQRTNQSLPVRRGGEGEKAMGRRMRGTNNMVENK